MIQLNSKSCHLYPNIITLIQFHKNITFRSQTIPILDFFILKGIPASILYNPFLHSSKSNLFKRKIRLHHSRLNPLLFIALNVQSKLLILACKSYLICSWLFLWMRVLLRAISLTTYQPCWLTQWPIFIRGWVVFNNDIVCLDWRLYYFRPVLGLVIEKRLG